MQAKRYSEEQIVGILKEATAGIPVLELCLKHGMSSASLYHWKAKYSGLEVSDLRRLKHLEDENRRLKQMVAEKALDIAALKSVASKTW